MINLRTVSYAYYVIWYTVMVISFSSSESSIFEVWTCGCCGLEKLDQDDNVGDAEMTYKGYLVVTKISSWHGDKATAATSTRRMKRFFSENIVVDYLSKTFQIEYSTV